MGSRFSYFPATVFALRVRLKHTIGRGLQMRDQLWSQLRVPDGQTFDSPTAYPMVLGAVGRSPVLTVAYSDSQTINLL
ncbi:MAG: hypothetical protein AAFV98_07990 [Chloroflexota bacterium]